MLGLSLELHFEHLRSFFFIYFSTISYFAILGGFLFVSGFVLLPLSCFVFSPLATACFQIFGYVCLPFTLGNKSEMKALHPFPDVSSISEEKLEIEVSPCVQAAWQLCKTLSPSKFSWGEGHLHFPFWQHAKKWLINKCPLRWRAFSTIPADEV